MDINHQRFIDSNSRCQLIHSKATNRLFHHILDKSLPAIKLSLHHEGRDTLWGKTKQSFQYIYDHYR